MSYLMIDLLHIFFGILWVASITIFCIGVYRYYILVEELEKVESELFQAKRELSAERLY